MSELRDGTAFSVDLGVDDISDGGFGYESSGLDSDEQEFVGCESRSASGEEDSDDEES